MKTRMILSSFAVAALTMAASAVQAAPTITVVPWLAPNAFGSPSFAAAQTNAVQAMYQGLATFGTPGTPSYFAANSTVTSAQAVVTGFPSWLGQVDPGTVFGAGFAAEGGNRMTFGLGINGKGTQFSISQLSFAATSTDPLNALAFAYVTGDYDYGPGYQGVLVGVDGVLGTGDDVFITSGLNTQLVDALYARGSGNSLAAYCAGCSLADQQAALDAKAASPGQDFSFTGTYTLTSALGLPVATGSGTFNVEIPEPGSLALVGVSLIGLGFLRRKR